MNMGSLEAKISYTASLLLNLRLIVSVGGGGGGKVQNVRGRGQENGGGDRRHRRIKVNR